MRNLVLITRICGRGKFHRGFSLLSTQEELIRQADPALCQAKRAGRNQVTG